ncbi:MAG: LCP family protein [Clostridiales bacterium]|nr:LCP family protein [Clostridiales bacterium]MCF8022931.1 LCP family protein [Clostridiales bacterium]
MTTRSRRHKKKKSILPKMLFVLLCLAVFTTAYGFASDWFFPNMSVNVGNSDSENSDDKNNAAQKNSDIEGFSVLLMGTDDRENNTMSTRTDTMMLMNYNDQEDQISLLSIPRDTRVELPGHWTDKINAANVYGGPELAVKTVSNFLDMPIDNYILTNFYGFKDIVDALGGVKINVGQDMYRPGEEAYGGKFAINLEKGEQVLNGDKALEYVRYRGYSNGDIGRTERQLKFLKALASKTMQAGTIMKLPELISEINQNVQTNLGVAELLKLARAGKNLDSVTIKTQTLPGHFLVAKDGRNYWSVDPEDARQVASALFEDGKVLKNVVQGATEDLRPREEEKDTQEENVKLSQENAGSSNSKESSNTAAAGDSADHDNAAGETPGEKNDTPTQDEQENNDSSSQPESQENTEGSSADKESESTPPGGLPLEDEEQQSGSEGSGDSVEIIIETGDNTSA